MTADHLAQTIVVASRALGGDGDVGLAFSTFGQNRGKPWQASTTIKPPRHRGRRTWAWGASPEAAMRALLQEVER